MSAVDDPLPVQPADADVRRPRWFIRTAASDRRRGTDRDGCLFCDFMADRADPQGGGIRVPGRRQPDRKSRNSAGMRVSNLEELTKSAADAGLLPARSLTGSVDALTRANEQEVTAAGWLADPQGDGDPLTLIIFVGGKAVASGKTSSERPDVTEALGLAFGAGEERDVRIDLSLSGWRTTDYRGDGTKAAVPSIGSKTILLTVVEHDSSGDEVCPWLAD